MASQVIGIVEIAADISVVDWFCRQDSQLRQRMTDHGNRLTGRTACPAEMVATDYVEADTDSLWAELQAEYCCIRQQLPRK